MSGEERGRSRNNSNRNNNKRSRSGRRGGRGGVDRQHGRNTYYGGRRANDVDDNDRLRRHRQHQQQQPGATRRSRGGRGNGGRGHSSSTGRRSNTNNLPQQGSNPFINVDSLSSSVVANLVSASTSSTSLKMNPLIDANSLSAHSFIAPSAIVASAMTSRTSSTITMDSDIEHHLSNQNINKNNREVITILPWPHPSLHYVPIAEEERLLPTLIRWGKNERGMMRNQPEFRLRQLKQLLQQQQQQQPISLLQSLSLRRHHLKLLNPNLRMSDLRLGSEENILEAATLFESSVSSYLTRHGVEFWTEKDQQRIHVRNNRYEKQPPTPDFRMKDGHVVVLDLVGGKVGEDGNGHNQGSSGDSSSNSMSASSAGNDNSYSSSDKNSRPPIITTIHWIEAKMFYGASTIPHGTSNAVGTILSKVKQYVALYGHGAIVFMYGCGDQLAGQLLDVGVLALDGRCLDLDEVVRHQRTWCSDERGNILF